MPKTALRSIFFASAAVALASCGTVDPGQDFQIAEVVYDEGYFYCRVEPMLFAQGCGPGADGEGGQCHFNVTTFRLRQYADPVSGGCSGTNPGNQSIPEPARDNYQSAQRQMRNDPDLAPLLLRPTRQVAHPRRIFEPRSPEAEIIREWATRYSSR